VAYAIFGANIAGRRLIQREASLRQPIGTIVPVAFIYLIPNELAPTQSVPFRNSSPPNRNYSSGQLQ